MTLHPLDVDVSELPAVFPSPFRQGTPHPAARRAAAALQEHLRTHLPPNAVRGSMGGKMFGVLVVLDKSGRPGALWGFAGMILGDRVRAGFVPPACDQLAFDKLWQSDGARVESLDRAIELADSNERPALVEQRREASRALLPKLQATYPLRNARGATTTLKSLFEPRPVPGGAGDCAAPKLLQYAHEHGLTPVALAEFWWGDSTPAGGRHHGVFYPACRGKCAVILPFMLDGVECEAPPIFDNVAVDEAAPQTVFEDADLWVVDKPAGLLSVPGKGRTMWDCVQHRLQVRAGFDDATWPRLVHRLDQATSGLLIAAKHKDAYVDVQRQFSRRTIVKRYEAVVHGAIQGEGTVDLALRPDIDDRPRQMHDPEHGKPAITRWAAVETLDDRTRLSFWPQTGRSHQLRLHAAHALGLGAPIVGDPLYGLHDNAPRLMLHAAELSFAHPRTGEPLTFDAKVPF